MDEDKFSCITEVTKTVYINLPSTYISNEMDGVKDVLESWKRQYIKQLQGVIVSYKNVSVVSIMGFIDTDNPFIRSEVRATFELFCPTIGSIVKGKINRVSHEHIGCLVHNIINATIKRSSKASYRVNQFISLDCMILFQITFCDFSRRVIRVTGEITEECVELMKELPPFNTQSEFFESAASTGVSSLESEDSMSIDGGNRNEDMEEESPSLLTSDYSSLRNPNFVTTFNVASLVGETSKDGPVFETPSPSHESDASSSDHITSNSMLHNQSDQESAENSVDENSAVQNTVGYDLPKSNSVPPSKKKKKHKDKKSKNKLSKKKSLKKAFTDFENQHVKSPSKKKKELSTHVKNVNSPKKHKKKSRKKLLKEIKQESPSQMYESTFFEEKDVSNFLNDEIINIFAKYEPSPEDQLLTIKEEPVEISKKPKKRKRESSDKEGLPIKKIKKDKAEGDKISSRKSKGKSEKKAKSKKKDKEKSKKHSKKDKKRKSKDKHLNSKDKQSGGEVKLKKEKKKKSDKSRTKKEKK